MSEASTHPGSDPARPGPGPSTQAEEDLQILLGATVRQLAAATGCPRVAAFGLAPDGTTQRLAATAEAAGPVDPDATQLEALGAAGRATDLGNGTFTTEQLGTTRRAGFSAGVALGQPGGGAPLLLLGGPRDPIGTVRRETLDALDAAAARLAPRVDAARAGARLAALGQEVERLDALASLGELVSEIVHEIRNPLVSVKTFLQLLPERAEDAEFRTQFLEVVGEEVRRIERLLTLVLDQARPENPPVGSGGSDPRAVFEAVVRLLTHRAQERGVTLTIEADDAVPIPLDRDALHQVVLNLAMNAIDATAPGGTVRLLATTAEGAARIACDDDGPGIPVELRERIFEPFFSTKTDRPGGLGLAIARRMVLASGGTLRVEARRPQGTRFSLAWAQKTARLSP